MTTKLDTIGVNEAETCKKTLYWTALWCRHVVRDLSAVVMTISKSGNAYPDIDYKGVTRECLIGKLDAINFAISSVVKSIGDRYTDICPAPGESNNTLFQLVKELDKIIDWSASYSPCPTSFSCSDYRFRDIEEDGNRTVVCIDGNDKYLASAYPSSYSLFNYIIDKINASGCSQEPSSSRVALVFAERKCVERLYEQVEGLADAKEDMSVYQALCSRFADVKLYYWENRLASGEAVLSDMWKKKEELAKHMASVPPHCNWDECGTVKQNA